MMKKITITLLLSTFLLVLAGCSTLSPAPAAQAPAVATVAPQTPTVIYVVVTATPAPTEIPTQTPVATETPAATATLMATPTAIPVIIQPTDIAVAATAKVVATASPKTFDADGTAIKSSSYITITNITYTGDNKALITWKSAGDTPSAFWIFYSTSYKLPFYGGYPEYVVGNTARSAYVDGDAGSIVYYRICFYNGSGCDFYSNSYKFTYPS